MARGRQALGFVEIGEISPDFRRALARALDGVAVCRITSLDAAFQLSSRIVVLVGESVDPVVPIQRLAPRNRAQVLVVCARAEGSEVARWARAGVTNCFVGVASLPELRALLACAANDSLDVQLDASDLAIEVMGTRTRLTRTQFRLVQHLSAKSGHWVTPSELVKEALGTHHANESALVRVHIHAIRRALGPLGSLIETDPARARGYRFRNDLVQSFFRASSFGEPSSL